ncbi:NUDIX domain-containing protein [Nitrospina gracilis]|uniref:NUDIX domain-containing protein n=1 Tax=Nitrospina gracilis TaxID=35801 RepID=UPI001F373238|nr:8-oxo-dGTP diphosphatase [Nitrospina gracilis Nb-211]
MTDSNKSESLPVFVGAIVSDPDGRVLCQLRDNKPGIQYPGYWTCSPGGHVEPGEPLTDAILRELHEEFEIEVDGLQPLTTLRYTAADSEPPGVYNAFTARLCTPVAEVRCNEGQKVDFFHPDAIRNLHVHPISLRFLDLFLTGKTEALS